MPMLDHLPLTTPAFVYDESRVRARAKRLHRAHALSGCRLLYSIKAFPFLPVLELLKPWVAGYSVSSLFEARLAAEVGHGTLHITTPGLREDEIGAIGELCHYIAFNSLHQFQRLQPRLRGHVGLGLRLNPKLSFLADGRYDPCRPQSKLGADLDDTVRLWQEDSTFRHALKGLHLHTVFGQNDFAPLRQTVSALERKLPHLLEAVAWINLGGGYLAESENAVEALAEIALNLSQRYALQVFFEPGNALIGQAGYLVASVIDVFESDGLTVAVLDTSVNHLPEVFEYQKAPQLACPQAKHGIPVLLAGGTCLAGDLFGIYRFERPPTVGERVIFRDVGAYSLIKAHRFNGHNLPTIYAWDGGENIRLVKSYGYADYQRQWTPTAACEVA